MDKKHFLQLVFWLNKMNLIKRNQLHIRPILHGHNISDMMKNNLSSKVLLHLSKET